MTTFHVYLLQIKVLKRSKVDITEIITEFKLLLSIN